MNAPQIVCKHTKISNILFQNDPAGTACNENSCFDEYEREAAVIVEAVLDAGFYADIASIVKEVLSNSFAPLEVVLSETMLKQISEVFISED